MAAGLIGAGAGAASYLNLYRNAQQQALQNQLAIKDQALKNQELQLQGLRDHLEANRFDLTLAQEQYGRNMAARQAISEAQSYAGMAMNEPDPKKHNALNQAANMAMNQVPPANIKQYLADNGIGDEATEMLKAAQAYSAYQRATTLYPAEAYRNYGAGAASYGTAGLAPYRAGELGAKASMEAATGEETRAITGAITGGPIAPAPGTYGPPPGYAYPPPPGVGGGPPPAYPAPPPTYYTSGGRAVTGEPGAAFAPTGGGGGIAGAIPGAKMVGHTSPATGGLAPNTGTVKNGRYYRVDADGNVWDFGPVTTR